MYTLSSCSLVLSGFFLLIFCIFGVFGGNERMYSLSFTVDDEQNDETNSVVWFRIIGANDVSTEWFKVDSFPSRDTTYDFVRYLSDIDSIPYKLEILRTESDHVVPKAVSVDSQSYTFSTRLRIGCCCYMLTVNFIEQTHSYESVSDSYCNKEFTPAPTIKKIETPTPTMQVTECEYGYKCKAWGDPHITTFDGLLHHFQGEGYFDYFTTCDAAISMGETKFPFKISAKQSYCGKKDDNKLTCIKQVIVTLYDADLIDPVFIIFSRDTVPMFYKNEIKTEAIGTFTFFDDATNKLVTYTITNNNEFEIEFEFDNSGLKAFVKLDYHGTRLNIEASDCLYGISKLCGLCGNIDNDITNEFKRCDNMILIDSNDVSTFPLNGWENTNNFGESCCNYELDTIFLEYSDCNENVIVPPQPNEYCINLAMNICMESYDLYCKDCDSEYGATQNWIDSCAIDICAACEENVLNGDFGVMDALSNGCLDTSINDCILDKYDDISDIIFIKDFDV